MIHICSLEGHQFWNLFPSILTWSGQEFHSSKTKRRLKKKERSFVHKRRNHTKLNLTFGNWQQVQIIWSSAIRLSIAMLITSWMFIYNSIHRTRECKHKSEQLFNIHGQSNKCLCFVFYSPPFEKKKKTVCAIHIK